MPEQNREPKRRKGRGMASLYLLSYKRRLFYRSMRSFKVIIGLLIIAALIYFTLAGGINQKETAQNIIDFTSQTGQTLGEKLIGLFTGESKLKFTEDGIYFKDAKVPDEGALEELPGDSENQNETSEDSKED